MCYAVFIATKKPQETTVFVEVDIPLHSIPVIPTQKVPVIPLQKGPVMDKELLKIA